MSRLSTISLLLKAAYKCELLLKQFMPKTAARRKSDTAKKTEKAVKAPAKKAGTSRANGA